MLLRRSFRRRHKRSFAGMIINRFPAVPAAIGFVDLIQGLAVGLIAGTLGSLYPAYKAVRMDPVIALSYD
jgi:ABC-type antimicrobial peptide transport system permease subunit